MRLHLPEPINADPEIPGIRNDKISGILVLMSLAASIASFPLQYQQTIQLAEQAGKTLPSFTVLMVSSVITGLIFSILVIALGLFCSAKTGLGPLLLQQWIDKKMNASRSLPIITVSVLTGIGLGIILLVLGLSIDKFAGVPAPAISRPSPLQFLLASIGAGINEEIWLRLGAMTFLVFMILKIPAAGQHRSTAIWTGNVLAAIVFGLIHLPQAQSLLGLGPVIVVSILFLNTLGGVVYGWVYWRYGLLMAMLTHFSTDIILHVLGPALLS